MTDENIKCFRCGAQPKILINMTIDDKLVKLCPLCYYEYNLFLEGHAIEKMILVERGHYKRKEEEE